MGAISAGPWLQNNLEYVMSYTATLKEPEVIGPLPEGLRLNFYVTGGEVIGPKIKGRVLPVGGDWLTIRSDGVGILDVRATVLTDDGALIYLDYTGALDAGPDGHAKALAGTLPDTLPLKVVSRVRTVHPEYLWLNRLQFVQFGEAVLSKLMVRYDVYALR
jgi:hypothetical protein